MKTWILVLVLLLVAAAAALGWQWVADDPGYVLIRVRGTSIETSLVVALAALLLVWAVISLGWRLLRWPLRAWNRVQDKRARENLANGLAAFAEGRNAHAERLLMKASKRSGIRGPAFLIMARAAHARGEDARACEFLDQAALDVESAALALRARFLLDRGRPADVLALLKPRMADANFAPVARVCLIEAALAGNDAQLALDALPGLGKSQSLSSVNQAALETRVYVLAMQSAASQSRLNGLWSAAPRNLRKQPQMIAAFARRAAAFGQVLAAMDEIESAQRREWDESLALVYGELGPAELATRMRNAEAWLSIAPNSSNLLCTLGRLCRDQKLWGKGIQFLERAVEIENSLNAWEALGDCYAGSGDEARALRCYNNALLVQRGKPALALQGKSSTRVDTHAMIVEERDQHGVPRLPRTG